jgi:hypothetical protein
MDAMFAFLDRLEGKQRDASAALAGAHAALRTDPEDQQLLDNVKRAISQLDEIDRQVAKQVQVIQDATATATAPLSGATLTPTQPGSHQREAGEAAATSAPPSKEPHPLEKLSRTGRELQPPGPHGYVDAKGLPHLTHMAEANTIRQRLGWSWELIDGIARLLAAGGLSLPEARSATDDPSQPAADPTAEERHAQMRAIADELEKPAAALVQALLEDGITLNVRHTYGPSVARAFRAPNHLEGLDSDHARKLAQALKETKNNRTHAADENAFPRERRTTRDYRPRERSLSPPPRRDYRRENDRSRDTPRARVPPTDDKCRRCGETGHYARYCKQA